MDNGECGVCERDAERSGHEKSRNRRRRKPRREGLRREPDVREDARYGDSVRYDDDGSSRWEKRLAAAEREANSNAPAREDFMVILDASLAGMKAEPPTAFTGARAAEPVHAAGARTVPDTARLAMDMVREAAIVPGPISGATNDVSAPTLEPFLIHFSAGNEENVLQPTARYTVRNIYDSR